MKNALMFVILVVVAIMGVGFFLIGFPIGAPIFWGALALIFGFGFVKANNWPVNIVLFVLFVSCLGIMISTVIHIESIT